MQCNPPHPLRSRALLPLESATPATTLVRGRRTRSADALLHWSTACPTQAARIFACAVAVVVVVVVDVVLVFASLIV